MSSKRRIRRRACRGKVRYDAWVWAEKARHDLYRSGRASGPLDVYGCPHCGGWHVGRRSGVAPWPPRALAQERPA